MIHIEVDVRPKGENPFRGPVRAAVVSKLLAMPNTLEAFRTSAWIFALALGLGLLCSIGLVSGERDSPD